ncbi:MAG: alpha-amylase/4-alpha-glucanotransferase domain-containing protein [Spirochaetia bacterium]
MNSIKLILGTYNSQPVGASDYQFERAYQEAYKPFLTVLYNYPDIPVVLYYSGPLLEWLEHHHPEFMMLLNDMVKRRQVELLGGGYYEPILPMIPTADRIGQIEMLTTYIRKRFGKRPRGSWVTERIWEPTLTSMFNSSGMEYVFLDDTQFEDAGVDNGDVSYCHLTEDQGKVLSVFPINTEITDTIPGKTPVEVIKALLGYAEEDSERIVVLLAEGERYGLRGSSHQICYRDGWFETFFSLLLENDGQIKLVRPNRFLKNNIPKRKIFFPSTLPRVTLEWTGNSSDKDDKNQYYRQLLTRYPESNLLYAKMIYTNILVNQIRGDKYRKKSAREELWKGQCNTPYWHNMGGGIYDNGLRKAAYRSLIEAEKITHEKGIFIPSILTVDFDMDGLKEYLYQGNDLNAYVHLRGGILFELDYLSKSWNYLDTISRQREHYHDKNSSIVDAYMRKGFIDHFFTKGTSIGNFEKNMEIEECSFTKKMYLVDDFDRDKKSLVLSAKGLFNSDKAPVTIELTKHYRFGKNTVQVDYTLMNHGKQKISLHFGSEINFSFQSKGMESHRIYNTSKQRNADLGNEKIEADDITSLRIDDIQNSVELKLSSEVSGRMWVLPVESVSMGENGIESRYQSTCFVPNWTVKLDPEGIWKNSIKLELRDSDKKD